jgi:thiol-disulfide isomerase/thioredoxin
MFWPDYSPRKKKMTYWRGIGILLILVASFFLAGEINGWWQLSSTAKNTQAEVSASSIGARTGEGNETGLIVTKVPVKPTAMSLTPLDATAAAPDFTLLDLNDSTRFHSLSDYAGKPVILNFWASWCVPCREEMPALQRIYELYNSDGLVVLGVNQTFVDNLETARTFVEELALTFPNAQDDEGDVSGSLYRVLGLPTSVFISGNRGIVHVQVGQLTDEQIARYTEQLMAGKEIDP